MSTYKTTMDVLYRNSKDYDTATDGFLVAVPQTNFKEVAKEIEAFVETYTGEVGYAYECGKVAGAKELYKEFQLKNAYNADSDFLQWLDKEEK